MAELKIPRKDDEFIRFAENLEYVIQDLGENIGVDTGEAAEYTGTLAEFKNSTAETREKRTAFRVSAGVKRSGRQKLEKLTRSVIKQIQARQSTTDALRQRLRITIRDKTRTPIKKPETYPTITTIDSSARLVHTVYYFQYLDETENFTPKRPAGVIGAEIWVYIGERNEEVSLKMLRFLRISDHSPAVIEHDGADVGKQAYYRTRWVNRKGETGIWSNISSHTVAG